jgi:hypothetical protein
MAADAKKMKHLDFIQLTITRMAANSFLLKAWGVTLVGAIFALSAANSHLKFVILALIPLAAFWVLDGYYLQQEKRFRDLYDVVRKKQERQINFSMEAPAHSSWFRNMFNKTELIFYGTLAVAVVITVIILEFKK